jgi:preprotein translocase subunit SecE
MKKEKVKTKGQGNQGKVMAANPGRSQVVKLKTGRSKTSWLAKLPSVTQGWRTVVTFVAEAWQELKKVTWPGRKETLGTTMVVLFLVFVISSYLGLVDIGLSALLKRIMHK